MSPFIFLFLAGLVLALVAMIYIVVSNQKIGSPALAAALSGGFGAFTAITILYDGVLPVWLNHTQNLWGVQVWWDLLISLSIALFLVLPRARAVRMNILPWLVFVVSTASIGLLAMVARLFWLEKRAQPA